MKTTNVRDINLDTDQFMILDHAIPLISLSGSLIIVPKSPLNTLKMELSSVSLTNHTPIISIPQHQPHDSPLTPQNPCVGSNVVIGAVELSTTVGGVTVSATAVGEAVGTTAVVLGLLGTAQSAPSNASTDSRSKSSPLSQAHTAIVCSGLIADSTSEHSGCAVGREIGRNGSVSVTVTNAVTTIS